MKHLILFYHTFSVVLFRYVYMLFSMMKRQLRPTVSRPTVDTSSDFQQILLPVWDEIEIIVISFDFDADGYDEEFYFKLHLQKVRMLILKLLSVSSFN